MSTKRRKSESIVGTLRGLLIGGEFRAGDKLQESQLAKRLNVSRTPIRLAFVELAKEGLLEYETNKGYSVRQFSPGYILSAVEVRGNLEAYAARQVAERGLTEESLRVLEACILQTDGLLMRPILGDREVAIWIDINGTFHETIVGASGNPVLIEVVSRFSAVPLASARSFAATDKSTQAMPQVIQKSQKEHRQIFEALCSGNSVEAGQLLENHVNQGKQKLAEALRHTDSMKRRSEIPMLNMVG